MVNEIVSGLLHYYGTKHQKKKIVLTVYEIINNCEHRKQHLKTLNTFKKYLHKFHAILSRKKYEIHHFFIIRFCF